LLDVRNDITLYFRRAEGRITGKAVFNKSPFASETVARITAHLTNALAFMSKNINAPVSDAELITDSELRQILVDWNDTATPLVSKALFHEIFEEQRKLRPDALAVVFDEQQLTYSELNRRANQLARYLRGVGAGPESIVGIMCDRSLDMLISLMAVLKAGGAYLPLDPNYPDDRLSYMLESSQARLILTQKRYAGRFDARDCRWICLEEASAGIGGCAGDDLRLASDPDHLAYVIYTSGSTGRPKGVMVRQAGLRNLVLAQRRAFALSADSRVLQFASLSFDASIFEVALALGAGATLVLGAGRGLVGGGELLGLLRRQQVSAVTLPPSVVET